jgi:hypothetical protein
MPILVILIINGIKGRNKQIELYDCIAGCINTNLTIEYNGYFLDSAYGRIKLYHDNKDEFFDIQDADKAIERFLELSGFMKYWEGR